MKRVLKYGILSIALTVLIVGAAIVLLIDFEYPGGMPSGYRAIDHDRRLTPIAREAAPIITAINRFYAAHGQCPRVSPDDLPELRDGLGSGVVAAIHGNFIELRIPKAVTGWLYYSSNQNRISCTLSRKLGWDPSLVWQRDGGMTQWIFVPGDGSEEIPLRLDIGE